MCGTKGLHTQINPMTQENNQIVKNIWISSFLKGLNQ